MIDQNRPIGSVERLASLMTADPTERVVQTFQADGPPQWHLVRRRLEVSPEVVRALLAAGSAGADGVPCLVPVADGLLPGTSQTYQFSVTLQKIDHTDPQPRRKRGRPRKPDAPGAAERMAASRDRKARIDVHRLLLIAAMTEHMPTEKLRQLETHRVFGPIIREARFMAKAAALTGSNLES
ncbi:hypothetical protein SAMN02982917_1982 [Azospirillum oryzae]|uniref:Uncharacterized protein n=1 Tax=Azospirillum oryzae TaxID=286727 RepID=A0A1X7ESU1_9PROT|nr:hypothetical protein [Azospirillum oryzae]SMF39357.1 hypothetical protein SAMN02982917_1982 [Azospirillum oryzae]